MNHATSEHYLRWCSLEQFSDFFFYLKGILIGKHKLPEEWGNLTVTVIFVDRVDIEKVPKGLRKCTSLLLKEWLFSTNC